MAVGPFSVLSEPLGADVPTAAPRASTEEPASEVGTKELSAADWTCIAVSIALAVAGLRVLRRWTAGGGPRLERRADAATAAAGLVTGLLAFGLLFPLLTQLLAGLFMTQFGVTQAEIFFSSFVAQAVAAGVIIGLGAALPGAVQWSPTAAPEGAPSAPDTARGALSILRKRDAFRAYLGVCALATLGSLGWKGLHSLWAWAHTSGWLGAPPEDMLQEIVDIVMRTEVVTAKFGLLTLAVAVGAPLMEELVFRGTLYPALKSLLSWLPPRGNVAVSAAATGLLFGAAHLTPSAFIPLTLFGAFLCLVRDRHGLATAIAVHAFFNAMNLFWLKVAPDVANL
ncbi:MAG: CPBP family intramembrane glutamic endopeptidase [Opitutales bacterium]